MAEQTKQAWESTVDEILEANRAGEWLTDTLIRLMHNKRARSPRHLFARMITADDPALSQCIARAMIQSDSLQFVRPLVRAYSRLAVEKRELCLFVLAYRSDFRATALLGRAIDDRGLKDLWRVYAFERLGQLLARRNSIAKMRQLIQQGLHLEDSPRLNIAAIVVWLLRSADIDLESRDIQAMQAMPHVIEFLKEGCENPYQRELLQLLGSDSD